MNSTRKCGTEGCERKLNSNNKTGYCYVHYHHSARSYELRQAYRAQKPSQVKDAYRRSVYKSRYGITLEEYEAMLASQGGVCAICGEQERHPSAHSNRICHLAVDHDHSTGKVRGLLCFRCNTALKKHLTPSHLRKMADYLEANH